MRYPFRMGMLGRITHLIVAPEEEWDLIAREPISIDALIGRYILPLSFLAPLATVVGMSTFDRKWDPSAGFLVPPEAIYSAGATSLLASILSILGLAAIFKLIAPLYGSSRDYLAALKVATFGAVPVLLAGATLVMPAMVTVVMVALCYSLYLYWLGVGRVLEVETGSQAEFVGISMVLLAAASTLLGALASSLGLF